MTVDDRLAAVTAAGEDTAAHVNTAESEQSSDALKRALRAVRDMKARVTRAEDAAHEPIAIVGVGCRLPGATDPEQYWHLLRDGVDAIGDIPADRWDIDEFYDPDPATPGKMVTRQGGFIRDIDQFDPRFFGITPREAVTMDPQQRLLIEVAWEALESAGIAPSSLAGSSTATFVGMAPGEYWTIGAGLLERGLLEVDAYIGTGNAMSVAAGRIAYALGLQGPNLALDTACSSSLVAVHLGVQSLRRGEADAAIVGGVNVMLDPTRTVYMSRAGALSPTDRCHTFDASADGYVRGEGCAMAVLKRLSDARADGDNVLAVIHGTAINHDGRSGGLTVPNGHAQQAVIRAALADARAEPASVSYVEAHGTGTPLGDPIEARALDAVYRTDRDGKLLIGSAKTNLGHLEAAAGIAGLLKLVLSLQHGTIPAHLHFEQPSPHIDWANTCLQVTDEPVEWVAGAEPRMAGLSSFGLSGTNCHVIVGDPPANAQSRDPSAVVDVAAPVGPRVVTLSAGSADGLAALAGAMASALGAPDAPALADVAHTLNTGRNELAHRLAIVAAEREEAARSLERHAAGERDASVAIGDVTSEPAPKIAFLFSGQGSQYLGMGRELYRANDAFRAALDECDERFQPLLGRSLLSLIHPPTGADSPIDDTTYTQPALFALEYALAQMWTAWGVRPDMMLGHSIGGIVAAHLGGVMSFDDAVELVAARGRLMGALPPEGSMLAVFADEGTVAAVLARFEERVTIAAINGPDNVVVSGPRDDVAAAAAAFGDAGVETRPLATSHAFHSPLMDPVLAEFESIASTIELARPRGRGLVSDHTGALGDEAMATAAYWVRHLRQPVRFADGIATLHDAGCNVFVEIGPSPTLTVMGQRCIPDAGALWLPSLVRDRPEPTRALTTLAALWTRGVGVDWQAFDPPGSRRRVLLPTTPFQRNRYWLPESSADPVGPIGGHPLLGGRSSSSGRDVRFDTQLTPTRATFLPDYVAHGRTELPAAAHAETLLAAGAALWGHDAPLVVNDLDVHEPLEVGAEPLHQQTTVSPVGRSEAEVTIDVRRADTGEWDRLADGRVSIDLDRPAPARVDLDELCDGLEPVSIDDLLSTWAGAGLVLGDRYRCITRLWTSGERTVAALELPHDAARYAAYPPALAVCALALHGDGVVRRITRIGALRPYSKNPATWCEMVRNDDGGSLRFIDEAGGVVAEFCDVVLLEDVHDRLPARAEWCYDVAWTESAALDLTAAPADARWTVIGANDGPSRQLCEHLQTVGVDSERIDESVLDEPDGGRLAALVRRWLDPGASDRPVSNIVYVVASEATVDPSGEQPIDQPIDTALTRTTRLLGLVKTLADEAWTAKVATPPKIWLVTRAAMTAGNGDVSPADGALWAMMKTVAAELPAFYGGMVDLDPAAARVDDEPRQLVGAIVGSGDETWLAIRGGEGRVARLRPDPPALDRPPLALRADGAYLVTGGFGALGMATARWLIDRGARRLIMLGRTPVPPRTEWAELQRDDAAATRVDAIRQLEALGASVHHPAVDVADRDALRAMLDDYRAGGWPPIRGVFHAAGELRDRSIPQMEAADVAAVLSSKARGAWNLHTLLADEPLDHFVCYSSVAAALGSPGQANYAAANGFLDGLVHLRRAAGRPGLSVNWGPWSAGMAAAEEVERRRERRRVPPIPVAGGMAVLGELLAADAIQAVVMPMTADRWSMVESPLVADLLPEDGAATRAVDDIGAELLSRPADERSAIVLEAVRAEVAAVAGLDADDVPSELGLIEVGLDSIMIVELATTLSRRFAVALDPREIFEEPSLTTLAATLLAAVEAGRSEAATDGRAREQGGREPAAEEPSSGCTIVMTTAAAGAAEIRSLIGQVAPDALLDESWTPSVEAIEALGDACAVHVSSSLGDDPDALESLVEQAPSGLRFVHLTRHPFAVIEELVDDLGLAQRDAEEVWTTVNGNLLDLAERVGPDRLLVVRYEELVTDPSATIDELVRFGALASSDHSAVELPSVQHELAQRWKSALLTQRPGRGVRRVAEDLGYDAEWPVDVQGGHPTAPTPDVADVASTVTGPRDATIPATSRAHRVQASPAQERLLFLDDFSPGLAVHNLPIALRLTGAFDRTAWAAAITEIVRRHEALRTNYEAVDGTYVQLIEPPSRVTVRFEDLRATPHAELDETIHREVAAEVARPFDLAHDLKLRAATFQLDDDVHVVVLTMHHIASDGWSMMRVVGELSALYGASVTGGVAALPELSIQYADYAAWQREQLQSSALQRQLAYWTDQLGGTLPVLDLPTDRPRPSPRSYRSDAYHFEVPTELVDAIRAHSRAAGATPFMTLLAAYAATLARYTGQSDVIIGTANANRQRPEVSHLVGLFVNTLALRVAVDQDETFDELLARVRRVSLDANRNQDVPFDRIVEAVRPPRDVTRSAIYQTMFTLHNMRPPEVRLPGVELEPLVASTDELDVDLAIEVTDVGDPSEPAMQGMLRFNVDLFDRVTVERLVDSWLSLLSAVVGDASTRLADVDLVSGGERAVLEKWSSSVADFGDVGGMRVEELFAAQVGRSPDAVAVVAGGEELTFAELDAASNRLGRGLLAAGVAPGDVVGVGVERSVSMVVALLAVLKTGAAYVPLDPGFPAQRLAFMVSDADVAVVLTSGSALIDQLRAADAQIVEGLSVIDVSGDAEVIAGESDTALDVAGPGAGGPDACGLAYVIYTSGSTGVPKGVQIEHRNVVNFLLSMRETPGLCDEDVLLAVTTLSFDISVLEIFLPLVTGARLVLAGSEDTIDGARLARLITSSQATVMQATPTTWSMLIEAGWDGDDTLRVLCGGEAMSRGLADELVARCGELWNMFGPTETTIWSTLMRIEAGGAGAVPIGSPIANTVCRILDPNDLQQPIGVPGELCIGGAGVARGYLDRPELTAERFITDPYSADPDARLYRTGDLARWRNDGTIEFLGRLDHQVKVRGHRIELGEIETALRGHDAIAEAVVIVREDQPGDQRITAYLTRSPAGDTTPPDAAELRHHLAGALPDYMVPSAYVTLEEFPQTPNRKIDRNALPRPETHTAVERVEPSTDLERQLCAVWADVLGAESPGVTQTFFELGGHSLLATRLVARMSADLGVDVGVRAIFEHPTIADLAASIGAEGGATTTPDITRVERDGVLPLSFAQERMWFLQQFEDDTSTLNIRAAVRVRGTVDVEVLTRSVDALTGRHEMLRTLYDDVMGEPAPRVLEQIATPLVVDDMRDAADPEAEATRILGAEADRTFELTSEPPVLIRLIRLADDDEILSVVTHHIASDGLSIPILLRDLSAFYEAFSDGSDPVLPELPIDYVDYAAWQRAQESGTFDSQLEYWTAQLGGDLGNCELPTDHPRPPVHTVDGAQIGRTIPDEVVEGLRDLGRRNGATLFMTLLAPFLLVLDRRIGRDDRSVTVGTPVAGRIRPELQDLIGVFLNTLVLRTDLDGDPTFDELLGRVRDVSLDAFANQDVPFEQLLAELQPPRDLSRTPFFSIFFNMMSVEGDPTEGPYERLVGHEYEILETPAIGSKFDLTMYVGERRQSDGAGVWMQLVYNRHLYDAATMEELFDQYVSVLEAVVADPRRPISTYSLVTDAARELLPDIGEELDGTWHGSVPEHVRRHAAESPDRTAVRDGSTAWRYDELAADMDRLANWLGDHGVKPGDVVAIYGHRSAPLVWAVTGALAAGAAYTILDPTYPPARLAEYIRIVRPTALVHLEAGGAIPDDVAAELDELGVEARVSLPPLRPAEGGGQLAGAASDPRPVTIGPDDLACVTMTSGSTGEPKAVMGRHGSLTHFLPWQSDAFAVGADDRFSMLSGLAHDPIQRDMFWPLAIGASIVVPDPEQIPSPGWLARWMRDERVTVAHLTPAMGGLVLEAPQTATDADAPIQPLRLALFIGEPLPRDLVDRLQARAPDVTIVNLYGTTETQRASGHLVLDRPAGLGDRAIVPLGVGIPGAQLLVRSADGTEAGIGEIGEIWMRSHHLALGYLDRPADTAERFSVTPGAVAPTDRLYRTGDLGRYRADGSVEFVGRTDQQVQIRGFRVELGDVRAALCEHDDVEDAVVVVRDDQTSARLVAYVVDGGTTPDPAELSAFLRTRLPAHMVPTAFVPIDAIPLTPNGKLDRRALPEPIVLAVEEGAGARDSLEQLLVGLWEDVLDRPGIGIHDNFFDLGGYSLLATRLFALLEDAIGERIPVATLFRAPTIEELAVVIRDSGWESRWSSLVPIQPRGSQPPLYYVNSYLISVLQLAQLGEELGVADQPLYGIQPRGIDGDLPPLDTIEDMAAHYISEIKSLQPHGPYVLGGHCSGAWVAFEMARQLEQMGDAVTAVLLVDLGPPGVERPEIPAWRYVVHRLKFFYGDGRLRHALGWQLKIAVNRLLLRRMGSEAIRTQGEVQAAHHRAHRAYTGGEISSNLVLIRSHETLALGDRGWFLKWQEKTTGQLFVADHVVGVHSDMLDQPNVKDLAAKMLESLAWAREEQPIDVTAS